jgi:hypothetical protein
MYVVLENFFSINLVKRVNNKNENMNLTAYFLTVDKNKEYIFDRINLRNIIYLMSCYE